MSLPGQSMPPIEVRPAQDCRFDQVSLGEVMLRLDPGNNRIRTTREFRVWEGGGEYNVARGLRRCFGLRTAVVTALADNEIGRLIEDLMLQGGVDLSFLRWVPYDGIGRRVRNGLNFTERGFGMRGAVGVSDRAYSAASQIRPGEVDWEQQSCTLWTGTQVLRWRYMKDSSSSDGQDRSWLDQVSFAPVSARPIILVNDGSFGMSSNRFGFNVTGTASQVVIVEGSTNLSTWLPLLTNTLGSGPLYFSDPATSAFPGRFYRARVGP